MTWLALLLAGLWVVLAWHDLRAVHALRDLPELPPDTPPADVSMVMAVRDDAPRLADAVAGLRAQRHLNARIVVIDDRSRDQTQQVLADAAAVDQRLDVRTVHELPPQWLGKPHALHLGAADATARWLLFTDGDARLAPDVVARAIAAAEREGAVHACLLPNHRDTSFFGRAGLLAFQLTVQRRVAAVNRDRPGAFVGVGAFTLVRSDTYRAFGGHEALRLEVVDDVWLGALVRRTGGRSRVWLAAEAFTIDWGSTPGQLLRAVEKNMFAVLRYRTGLALAAIVGSTTLLAATALLPIVTPYGWLAVAAYLATGIPGAALARRLGWERLAGLFVPIARVLLPIALLRSTWVTLRRGGVAWRGTFYPLAMLRRGQVPDR